MSAEYVRVYQCHTEPEAGFIRGLFEDEGLRVQVHGQDISALDLVHNPIQILVHPEDLERAERLLDRHESPGSTAEVACPRCRSTNESHFALCWNCGKELE